MVRAKCKVMELKKTAYGDTVTLQPVTSGKGNESWSKWTPSGKIELLITNPDAVVQFELSADYYVDFTPVPPEPKP